MFTPVYSKQRKGRPATGLLKPACLGLLSVVLLTPSVHAQAKAKAANDLVNLINQYRQQKNLPAIPLSQKLTTVAMTHMEDLVNNEPHKKLCPADPEKQNEHSWSHNGTKWKGGCYDSNNKATWPIMWEKPKEITGYPTYGYENFATGSTAQDVLDEWKKSDLHNPVILNQGEWQKLTWKAIGAAECQGYWCVWFGETLDTSSPPNKTAFLKGYDDPKKAVWVSDLIQIDPSKVKKLGGDSASGGEGKPDEAAAPPKGAPSGSRVNAGVHGRVYAMDPSGKLLGTVSGAAIELKSQSGAAVSQITSGENGYYRADLSPGRYFYKVTAPGYKDEDKGRGFDLQKTDEGHIYNFWLVKGENDPNRKPPEIPSTPIATLKGTVWEKTEDGKLVGISQAVVSLRQEGSAEMAHVTSRAADKDGKSAGAYQIVLAAGTWKASANAPGFEVFVDPEPIAIVAGKEAIRDFVLERRKIKPPTEQGLKGTVRAEGLRIGQLPEDLKVEIFRLPGTENLGSTPIDAAGGFRKESTPGAYRVRAQASGFLPADSGVKHVLPEQYTLVTLLLRKETPQKPETPETPETPVSPPLAKLLVKVVGADGDRREPLANARVLLRYADEDLSSAQQKTTDAAGEADFSIKSAGRHSALAQCKGYQPAGSELDIGPNDKLTTTIVLNKRPTGEEKPPAELMPVRPEEAEPVEVSGYVVYKDAGSSTGAFGVDGARLSWRLLDPRRSEEPRVVTTESIGAFRIELREGEYEVSFALPEQFLPKRPERLLVRVGMEKKWFYAEKRPEGEPTEPEIEPMPESAGEMVNVRGHVVARSSRVPGGLAAVGGATIHWHPRRGQGLEPGAARSDDRGRFSLNLREGFYTAEVEPPPGYRPTIKQVRVQEGIAAIRLILERIEQEGELPPEEPTQPPPEEQQPPQGRGGGLALQVFGREAGKVFPLAACQVRVTHGRRIAAQGQTDRAGRFHTQLANGSYEAIAIKDGFNMGRSGVVIQGQNMSQTIYLDRQPGKPPETPGEQPPDQLLSLQVHVMVSFPTPPKQGKAGGFATTPAGGANVTIVQGRRTVASGKTDQGGNYTARLQPGSYQINVSHGNLRESQGVTLQRSNVSRTITLQSGAALMPNIEQPAGRIELQPLQGPLKIIPKTPQLKRVR